MKNETKHTPGPWSEPLPTGSSKFEIQTTVNQKQFLQRVAIVDRLEDAHLIKVLPEMISLVTEFGNFLYSGRFENENGWIDEAARDLMGKVEEVLARSSGTPSPDGAGLHQFNQESDMLDKQEQQENGVEKHTKELLVTHEETGVLGQDKILITSEGRLKDHIIEIATTETDPER